MKNRVIYFVLLFSFLTGALSAQQDPAFSFYRYSMNLVNPAYAGAEGRTEFGANIRSQWSGVIGAPETQSFLASSYFGKNVGLGVSIINDKTFIEKQTSIAIDFSYRLQWNETTDMYMGLKASGNTYNANTAGLLTYGIGSDPSLMNLNGGLTPNVGLGILVVGSRYSVALSAPKILKPERLEQDGGAAKLGRNKMQVYLMGAYDFDLGPDWVLKPSAMLRYIESAPFSMDVTVLAAYQELLEFGGAYRLDEGLAGLLLFNLGKGLSLGYAYEAATQAALNSTNKGTHEILMKIHL